MAEVRFDRVLRFAEAHAAYGLAQAALDAAEARCDDAERDLVATFEALSKREQDLVNAAYVALATDKEDRNDG